MVPFGCAPPGQHFLAMAPMPGVAPAIQPIGLSPMVPANVDVRVGVAVPFPSCTQPSGQPTDVMGRCGPSSGSPETCQPCQPCQPVCQPCWSSNFSAGGDFEREPDAPEPCVASCPVENAETVVETVTEEVDPQESVLKAAEDVTHLTLKVRSKKPTRRGGKRARHRPCHAAATEWASSVGSAETPSFGEPGSGEEAEDENAEDEELEKAGSKASNEPKTSYPNSSSLDPKAKRSFYPLAARLRLASANSANLKASKGDEKALGAKISSVYIKDPLNQLPSKSDLISQDWNGRWFGHSAPIEVIEEVEPEPASASDVSDIPKAEVLEELCIGS